MIFRDVGAQKGRFSVALQKRLEFPRPVTMTSHGTTNGFPRIQRGDHGDSTWQQLQRDVRSLGDVAGKVRPDQMGSPEDFWLVVWLPFFIFPFILGF